MLDLHTHRAALPLSSLRLLQTASAGMSIAAIAATLPIIQFASLTPSAGSTAHSKKISVQRDTLLATRVHQHSFAQWQEKLLC